MPSVCLLLILIFGVFMIDPHSVAFDIDGVFADIVPLFIDIACSEYNINGIRCKDITSYKIEDCLDIDVDIVEAIMNRILDESRSEILKPVDGSAKVLTRLGMSYGPILFVTARPYSDPIYEWMLNILPLEPSLIEIVATGTFEGKADVLLDRNISYFVEDRLETCFSLKEAGVTPVLFKQPWNRESHPFVEVGTWNELESLIEF